MLAGGVGSALVFGWISTYAAVCKGRVEFEQLKHSGTFGEERFEVKSKLGEGGQAEVFKALDKKTRRLVAINVTLKSLPQGKDLVLRPPSALARFIYRPAGLQQTAAHRKLVLFLLAESVCRRV